MQMQARRDNQPTRVGKYKLLNKLGAGGMGTVWLAESPDGKLVALKLMHEGFSQEPNYIKRFEREIAAIKRVGGRFTAQVLDSNAQDTRPWIVTEYIQGMTLAEMVRAYGKLGEDQVRVLAAGVVDALISVHAANIVHRDLKPSNIMIGDEGVRVIDFGIAAGVGGTKLTGSGLLIGSAGYMAPEYLEKGIVLPAADVFAFGVVLVFAVTGREPFDGDSHVRKAYAVVHHEPNLDGVPDGLRPLIERCLNKDPARRPSLDQIRRELRMPATLADGTDWLPAAVATAVKTARAGVLPTQARPVPRGVVPIPGQDRRITPPDLTKIFGQPGPTKVDGKPTQTPVRPVPAQRSQPKAPPIRSRSRGGAWLAFMALAGILAFVLYSNSDWAFGLPQDPTPAPPRPSAPSPGRTQSAKPPVVKPSKPASTPPALAPAPKPQFRAGKLGTSVYEGGGYSAKITNVSASGYGLVIRFDARGQNDLREPQSSCVKVKNGDKDFYLKPYATNVTKHSNSHYSGTLTVALALPGAYSFIYSCEDYSEVVLGRNTARVAGISEYNDSYAAVVLAAQKRGNDLVLDIAVSGESDLRQPEDSCVETDGGQSIEPVLQASTSRWTEEGAFWQGRMTFRGAGSGEFIYSCSGYSAVKVPA